MELYFASENKHKYKELSQIFKPHTLVMPRDDGISFEFVEGDTDFLTNALGKATELYKIVRKPVLADDSGLCVSALDGAPGVLSARYGSIHGEPPLPDADKISLLLENLRSFKDRSAFFVCAMVIVLSEYRFYTVQETVAGSIVFAPAGNGGFGYDPVFLVEDRGCTMAELSEEEKNRLSHRARAARKLKTLIPE